MERDAVGIGLIGTGYLGKAFTVGYLAAPVLFGPRLGRVEAAVVAASGEESARRAARELGYGRWTGDWRRVVDDPAVDVVVVNTPNHLHRPIALAAIAAGKHVHCEKPLGLNAEEAREMRDAAEAAGVRTIVGFNYRQNPATQLAREIIAGGELGEVISVRATHDEDYLADPELPLGWRVRRAEAGHGALHDVGSHVICIVEYLLGEIESVCGQLRTVITTRPVAPGAGERGEVENDDEARFLLNLRSGAAGYVEASRIATGRKMLLSYEVTGSRGSLYFNQERMSELQLYEASARRGRQGFKTIFIGPEHPDYAAFCPGPGHGVGFNDQKVIECRRMLEAIRGGGPASPDFREAWHVNRVTDAVARSHAERGWVRVAGD